MDSDNSKDMSSSREPDDVVGGRGEDGSYHPVTLTHEQEMALQQIIESNHLRQLRSTSPLPISGSHCLGASAPPNHSGEAYDLVDGVFTIYTKSDGRPICQSTTVR